VKYHNKPWQMSGHYAHTDYQVNLTGCHYTFTKWPYIQHNCIASSLFLWHNLAHFGIPYLCLLSPIKSRPSEGNNQAIAMKDNFYWLKILIPVTNTSMDDMYVTTSCCLTMHIVIAYVLQKVGSYMSNLMPEYDCAVKHCS